MEKKYRLIPFVVEKAKNGAEVVTASAGWLFWCVRYFVDYKPCGYVEDDVKIWMCNYTNQGRH